VFASETWCLVSVLLFLDVCGVQVSSDEYEFRGGYEFEKIYEEELPEVRREDVYARFDRGEVSRSGVRFRGVIPW
jgi:hypothetical protein